MSAPSKERVLDFAIITKTIGTAPWEDDTHLIEFDPIELTSDLFDAIFYSRKNGQFSIAENIYDGYALLESGDPYLMSTKTIGGKPFNLVSSVIAFYEQDIGITYHNWEFSTIIKVKKALQGLNSIFDFYRYATSMTRRELVAAIFDEGGIVNGIYKHTLRLQLVIVNIDPRFRKIRLIIPFRVNLTPGRFFVPNYLYILSQLIRNQIIPCITEPFIFDTRGIEDGMDRIIKRREMRAERSVCGEDTYMNVIDQLNDIPNYQFKLLALDALAVVDRGKIIQIDNDALQQQVTNLQNELEECRNPRPKMTALITTEVSIDNVVIDPTYIYYIRDYGKPYKGVFEPEKIAEIRRKYSLTGT
jgi:hypothetical protein